MKRKGSIKRKLTVGIVFLMFLSWGGSAYAERSIFFFLGSKDTEKLGELSEFGVEVDFHKNEWPVSLVVGYFASSKESDIYLYTDPTYGKIISNRSVFTSELAFGVKKIWGSDVIQPFLGGGLALVNASYDYSNETADVYCDMFGCHIYSFGYGSDHGQTLGLWLDSGVYLKPNENLKIGLNVRWSKAEVNLFGGDVDAGGVHFGIQAGFHF